MLKGKIERERERERKRMTETINAKKKSLCLRERERQRNRERKIYVSPFLFFLFRTNAHTFILADKKGKAFFVVSPRAQHALQQKTSHSSSFSSSSSAIIHPRLNTAKFSDSKGAF